MASKRRSCFLAAVLATAGWLASPAQLHAEAAAPSEYDVEAAFLLNFAKFASWPPPAFSAPDEPLRVGILGDDPFGPELNRLANSMRIQNRPLEIVRSHDVQDLAQAHLIFISLSEASNLSRDIAVLRKLGSFALTVSDSPNFLYNGGMIRLFVEHNKVRFEINATLANDAGIRLSSRLLSLAANNRRT